ncbi:hypothetical protein QBZ16_002613 [Prototheca wickerhamii]|uniref:Heterogeneous nuclear ribonucleoprotein Q acidic domain-containing protein n=1 Tax=Prototheca wickerhamii TaxID=3111 RepID=A0AAD9IIH8_PROWI|nr:hypothetical protein QBZ16_002613 [Prototheca wickerhamii]
MQGGRVRNPAAYLAGVLRRGSRVRAEHGPGPDPPEPYHRDEPPPSADPRSQITPAAEAKLREVGVLSGPNALDDRSLGTLLRNPPEVQYVIADAFTTRHRRDPGGRADPGGYSDDRDRGPAYAARRDPGAYAPAAPAAAPAAPAVPAVPAGLKHQGLEQLEWGVRVDEFHGLSPLAKYVHPAAALKLQQLWDQGNRLVSLLDDSSWERLARLDTQAAVATVNEAAEALRTLPPDDLVAANAAFVTIASRFAGGGRAGGPGAGPGPAAAAVPAAAPYAPIAGATPPRRPRQAGRRRSPPYAYGSGPGPTAAGPHGAGLPARPGPYKSAGPPIYTTGPVARLTPAVQRQLAEAVATSRGLLRPEHFNEGLVDMLLELGDSEASNFLGRLGARDLSQVRNMSGYIYGTLRRGEGMGGPPAGGAGPGMHAPRGMPDFAGQRQLAGPRYRPY